MRTQMARLLVSIQLISPASGDKLGAVLFIISVSSFHSINIPSEWGLDTVVMGVSGFLVSIQLISPASGDKSTKYQANYLNNPFPFN